MLPRQTSALRAGNKILCGVRVYYSMGKNGFISILEPDSIPSLLPLPPPNVNTLLSLITPCYVNRPVDNTASSSYKEVLFPPSLCRCTSSIRSRSCTRPSSPNPWLINVPLLLLLPHAFEPLNLRILFTTHQRLPLRSLWPRTLRWTLFRNIW